MRTQLTTFAFFVILFFHSICFADDIKRIPFSPAGDPKTYIYRTMVGDFKLELESPDHYKNPKVWDSPLYIYKKDSNKGCETESLLVTDVYFIEKAQMILIKSYSGSMSYVDFIDIHTCKEKYRRIGAYAEKIIIDNNQIQIYPGCECGWGNDQPCQCSAAKVMLLVKNFQPVIDKKASDELTRKIIGVVFEGDQEILFPKTKKARLITK